MKKPPKSSNISRTMSYRFLHMFFVSIFLCCGLYSYGQGKVTRPVRQQTSTNIPKKSIPKATISEPDGYINSHGYVDLGLPSGTKWGTCNIGASSPEGYGNYFAWGESAIKDSYNEQKSYTFGIDYINLEGQNIVSAEGILEPHNDAARLQWGIPWRMPTTENFEELIENCKWEEVVFNTKRGWIVQGKNGKSIFLPNTGYRHNRCHTGGKEDSPCYSGSYGYYWTATVCKEDSECSYLYKLDFKRKNKFLTFGRDGGATVRGIISIGE